jgi:hypothetical protein
MLKKAVDYFLLCLQMQPKGLMFVRVFLHSLCTILELGLFCWFGSEVVHKVTTPKYWKRMNSCLNLILYSPINHSSVNVTSFHILLSSETESHTLFLMHSITGSAMFIVLQYYHYSKENEDELAANE